MPCSVPDMRRYDTSNHTPFPVGDPSKRAFTYFVLTGGRFVGAAAVRLAVLKFLLSMTATKDVLAMANLEVDLSNIAPGQTVTVKWRGKPVFIRHRRGGPAGAGAAGDAAPGVMVGSSLEADVGSNLPARGGAAALAPGTTSAAPRAPGWQAVSLFTCWHSYIVPAATCTPLV